MPGELGAEWDPMQGSYSETMDGGQNGMIPGLMFLSVFSGIGVGAFLGAEGMALGAPISFTEGITIDGVTYFGMTQEGAQAIAALGAGAITQDAATAIQAAAIMGGGTALEIDAAAFLALDQYNPSQDLREWQNFGDYLSLFQNGYIGPGIAPGYPGFPGYGYPNPFGVGGMVCYVNGDTEECHWEE